MNQKKYKNTINKLFQYGKYIVLIATLLPLFAQNEAISDKKKKEIFNVSKLTSQGPNAAPKRKKGEIDFETLKNRSSTIKWRNNMSKQERKLYDKEIYKKIKSDPEELEAKRERQRNHYEKYFKN